jgi:hypothetical protein
MARILAVVCAVASLAVLVVESSAEVGVIEFLPHVNYDLEFPEPMQIATADFDNNGHIDLAASTHGGYENFDGAAVTILLADGTGAFIDNPSIGENVILGGVVAADFDTDGFADVAYVRLQPQSQIVLAFGDGTGSFTRFDTIDVPTGELATGDFNSDGVPDLVSDNQLSVLFGVGDGTFAPPVQNPHFYEIADLQVADMNLDGVLDVVVATHQGWVLIFLGDGSGRLDLAGSAGGGVSYAQWNHVAVGDLDNDYVPDVTWVLDYPCEVKAAFGSGDGSLEGEHVIDTYGISPYDAVVADFDRDGRNDLAVTLRWSTCKVYQGSGGGAFLPPLTLATGMEPEICDVLDLDQDQFPDLVIPCRNLGDTPHVAVHLNRSAGPVGVANLPIATAAQLLPAAPNPFAARTHVDLTLPGSSPVRAGVFDVAGRNVWTFHEGLLGAGTHLFEWDGRDRRDRRAAAGLYFIRMEVDGRPYSREVVLLD